MERRTFMNNAAGAATALAFKPMALAGEHDKTPVSIPIRWWKWVSLGRKIQSASAAVERLYTGTQWAEGQCASRMGGIPCSATFPTTGCCGGSKTQERSAFSLAPRTIATVTSENDGESC